MVRIEYPPGRPKFGDEIINEENITEEPTATVEETQEEKPSWVEAAEAVVPQDSKSQRKIVSNEIFIRAWNQSEYLHEAAEEMGIEPASARARAHKLRKTFSDKGIVLKLKVHLRKPRKSSGLGENPDELARLAQIAHATYDEKEKETDESQE